MLYLAVVRHGAYVSRRGGDRLTYQGDKDVRRLARALKERLGIRRPKVLIFSSDATRARESAAIFTEVFGKAYEVWPLLYSDGSTSTDTGKIAAALAARLEEGGTVDCVILITHLEYALGLPARIAKGLGFNPPTHDMKQGEATLIDYARNSTEHLALPS